VAAYELSNTKPKSSEIGVRRGKDFNSALMIHSKNIASTGNLNNVIE